MNPHPGGFAGFVHVAQEVFPFLTRGTKQTVHYIGLFGRGFVRPSITLAAKRLVANGK